MSSRTVIDGNAFYEIDEDCLKQKKEIRERKQKEAPDHPAGNPGGRPSRNSTEYRRR